MDKYKNYANYNIINNQPLKQLSKSNLNSNKSNNSLSMLSNISSLNKEKANQYTSSIYSKQNKPTEKQETSSFVNYGAYHNRREKENDSNTYSNRGSKEDAFTLDYYRYRNNEENNNKNKENNIQVYKKLVGLDNLGNTCFMNTSLQCLIHSEIFILRLYKLDSLVGKSITTSFYEICQDMKEKFKSVRPNSFKSAFGSLHSIYLGYSQQDSQEFLRRLLEDISKETNRISKIPPYRELDTKNKSKTLLNNEYDKIFRAREDSIVVDTFYGQFVNIFTCVDCMHETYSFEKFLDIPILIEDTYNSQNIYALLDEYFKEDRFKWDSPCENQKCKKKSYHTKKLKISDLPEILILTFQRYNGRNRKKITSRICFEEKIDMSKYIDRDCNSSKSKDYILYAVSNHSGSLDFGHYYAYCKIDNIWYEFNDSSVAKCPNFITDSNSVYVLFYQRIN